MMQGRRLSTRIGDPTQADTFPNYRMVQKSGGPVEDLGWKFVVKSTVERLLVFGEIGQDCWWRLNSSSKRLDRLGGSPRNIKDSSCIMEPEYLLGVVSADVADGQVLIHVSSEMRLTTSAKRSPATGSHWTILLAM